MSGAYEHREAVVAPLRGTHMLLPMYMHNIKQQLYMRVYLCKLSSVALVVSQFSRMAR